MDFIKVEVSDIKMAELINASNLALNQSLPLQKLWAKYGAAVLTSEGNIYRGFNVFSSSNTLSIHAEQCAIINAYINNETVIYALAVTSDDESTPPIPCGICRQFIFENARYSKIDILVLSIVNNKIENKYYLSELYPNPWPNRNHKIL